MDIKTVETLVELFNKEGLTKLKVSGDDGSIHIEKNHSNSNGPSVNGRTESPDQTESESSGLLEITATQVGTFYMNKEEDSDEVFKAKGDSVKQGDTVGLIEAMKVFNEVTSEHTGIVEEIHVDNGDTVEYGQVIMTLTPEEA